MIRPLSIAFLFWGRRGAMTRFSLDLAQAAAARPDIALHVSISYQNDLFARYAWLGDRLLPIDTFASTFGVVRTLAAIPAGLGIFSGDCRNAASAWSSCSCRTCGHRCWRRG